MKLTEADISTLSRAQTLRDRFESGIFPTGSGQHRHFAKLERLGLLAFDGYGRDIDGMRDGDVAVYQLTDAALRELAQRETARVRRMIERPERCRFWGQDYTIVPRLIARVFGDGKHLLCVTPLATRPNYFVVRVDSMMKDPRDPFPPRTSDPDGGYATSLLDDIMSAAEEEYGYFGDEEYRGKDGEESRPFPVTDWGIGICWGEPFHPREWNPAPPFARSSRRRPVRK